MQRIEEGTPRDRGGLQNVGQVGPAIAKGEVDPKGMLNESRTHSLPASAIHLVIHVTRLKRCYPDGCLARPVEPQVPWRDTGAGLRKLRQLDAAATVEDPAINLLEIAPELLKGKSEQAR